MSEIEILSRTQKIIVNQIETVRIEVLSKSQRIIVDQNADVKVQVISRTQQIIVNQTPSVRVVNAGPAGPPGINGMPGVSSQYRWYGEGPPGLIIGASPNDEYLDTLTGDLYTLQ